MADVESSAPQDLSGVPADLMDAFEDSPITGTPLADDGKPLSDIGREILAQEKSKPTKKAAKAEAAPPERPDSDEDFDDIPDVTPKKKSESHKVKANGKEYEFDSIDKLKAAAGRGLAIQQTRAKEKAEMESTRAELESMKTQLRQQMDTFQAKMESLEKDPETYLRSRPNAEDIAEKLLLERAQEWQRTQNMTPRERELYEREKAAQARIKDYEAKQKAAEEAESERLVEQQKEEIARVFGAALEKHSLPTNTTTLRVMASIYRAHLAKGVQLSEEQAAQLTRAQLADINKDVYGKMDAETFVNEFPDLAEAVRKHYVAKARQQPRELSDVAPKGPRGPNGASRQPDGRYASKKADDSWEDEIKRLKEIGHKENIRNRVY